MVSDWTLVLEALGSIPMVDKKKIDGTCFPYCHLQASQVTEFDLGVKWVKVNPGSSFEQITMGHSSQWYIHTTYFQGHYPTGSREKRFLKIIYHIWSWQLWRPWSCDWDQLNRISYEIDFNCPAVFNIYWVLILTSEWPWQSLQKLQDCLTKPANFHSVLQKISVCLTNVLWFLARRDSNLITDKPPVLQNFILSCQKFQSVWQLSCICWKDLQFPLFPIQKHMQPNLTLR